MTLGPAEVDLASLPWLEPNSPSCRAEDDGAEPRWILNVRVPLQGGQPNLSVQNGEVRRRDDPGHLTATVRGGPCSGAPPKLTLNPR